MKAKVLDFLKNRPVKLCAFATVSSDGQPWNAIMGYAVQDDLAIILSTHKGSRKYQNLQENTKVSVVIGWEFSGYNVQLEGEATFVEDGEEYSKAEEFFFGQNPHAAKFKSPDTIYIIVTPTFMRVTNFNIIPPKAEEVQL